eukprot:6178079-Pleurochrysis_carterae.AAC.1
MLLGFPRVSVSLACLLLCFVVSLALVQAMFSSAGMFCNHVTACVFPQGTLRLRNVVLALCCARSCRMLSSGPPRSRSTLLLQRSIRMRTLTVPDKLRSPHCTYVSLELTSRAGQFADELHGVNDWTLLDRRASLLALL